MTIEEIKSAINRCNLEIECMKEAFARYAKIETMTQKAIEEMKEDEIFLNQSETIKKVLENELERLENKPLSCQQLENMLDEYVWDKYDGVWRFLVDYDDLRNRDEIILEFDSAIIYYRDDRFYRRKPQEVQDD